MTSIPLRSGFYPAKSGDYRVFGNLSNARLLSL